MTDRQYKVILDEIRQIKSRVDDIDRGLGKDREKIQDLNIRLENVESETKQTRQAINRSSEVVKDKVADVVEPLTKSTDRLEARIEKSRMVVLKEKLSWWRRLFGEVRKEIK
jgi:chromosome segregation ATPase